MRITDYKTYEEARKNFTWDKIWALFDGNLPGIKSGRCLTATGSNSILPMNALTDISAKERPSELNLRTATPKNTPSMKYRI